MLRLLRTTPWMGILFGIAIGIGISQCWPARRLQATATDRSDQYAICTAPGTALESSEGIFTLDFLTGDLKGAMLNRSLGKFTQFYYRNIIQDFGLEQSAQAKYALVSGQNLLAGGRGGVTPAPAAIYVAELNSGRVIAYGFPYRESQTRQAPAPFVMMDGFPFRQPTEKE